MGEALRVAVVEDDPRDRQEILKALRRYEAEAGVLLELREFSDGEDLVTDYAADYDLILLDIELRFMDGMRTARAVRALDKEVPIVFVTNAPQYAIEGYKVRAVDYVLKPIAWFSFRESLSRALAGSRRPGKATLTLPLREGRIRLEVDRICYVEVQDHLLIYNTLDGRYVTKGTMHQAEEQLKGPEFCRCNRCYIVNLRHVDACVGSDIRVNGDVIQVSRRQRRQFLERLNLFMNGDGR